MSAAFPPRFIRAGDATAGRTRDRPAAARFLALVPALLAGVLCLRAWSLWALGEPPTIQVIGSALFDDLVVFGRGLPLLFLLSWPLLRIRAARPRTIALALLWGAWLVVQIALEQYFLAARVPLGADLFGYSLGEIATTAGGARTDAVALLGWLLPLVALFALLVLLAGKAWRRRRAAVVALAACLGLWFVPLSKAGIDADTLCAGCNRLAYFAADNLRYWSGGDPPPMPAVATNAEAATPAEPQGDPEYPFLRREQAPDVLGPHFQPSATPPNLVFILVEGLGRSFSGPDAALGSFTPFLDELAGRSLYWSNFLAPQGRTFGVLPSVFGSLPFGEKGFAALGERMPRHAGLLSVLKQQGYGLRFYAGFDSSFDNEGAYLRLQGVDHIVDLDDFGRGYTRNPHSTWGYDDDALVARVLADPTPATPSVTVIQTVSMHTPYRLAAQEAWRRRFEQRLDELEVEEADRARYRANADIYASVLFTDDALRRYFEAMAKTPGYDNTMFIVTGDHRLPEIPMDTKIERYHVPLIVFSPLLKQPARIRGVSSQLDITPSLLAYLANQHGLQRPAQVAWTGLGLDTSEQFRNERDIPLKHAKTLLADFVSGPWFVSHEQLYRLQDGLRLVRAEDEAVKQQVLGRFGRYRRANEHFARTLKLSPEGDTPALVAYTEPVPPIAQPKLAETPRRALYVHDVAAPEGADAATLEVGARFTNGTAKSGVSFVPLLVLSDRSGQQVRESYAAALHLDAGGSGEARFEMPLEGLPSGQYFIAVLPSHPETGRRMGEGAFRIPLKIRCCAPGGGALARP